MKHTKSVGCKATRQEFIASNSGRQPYIAKWATL